MAPLRWPQIMGPLHGALYHGLRKVKLRDILALDSRCRRGSAALSHTDLPGYNTDMTHIVLKIGNFAAKHAIWIVLFWLVLALCLFLAAPSLSKVGVTEESQFLPHGAESVVARDIVQQKFPEGVPAGSAILALYDSEGWYQEDQLDPQYSAYVDELTQWLDPQVGQAPETVKKAIESVTSVTNHTELKDYLVSSDNTTMLINLNLKVSSFSHEAEKAVKAIR
jgi:uncharacterized membrane protein YdfJ with MMPL/SSD domain